MAFWKSETRENLVQWQVCGNTNIRILGSQKHRVTPTENRLPKYEASLLLFLLLNVKRVRRHLGVFVISEELWAPIKSQFAIRLYTMHIFRFGELLNLATENLKRQDFFE